MLCIGFPRLSYPLAATQEALILTVAQKVKEIKHADEKMLQYFLNDKYEPLVNY